MCEGEGSQAVWGVRWRPEWAGWEQDEAAEAAGSKGAAGMAAGGLRRPWQPTALHQFTLPLRLRVPSLQEEEEGEPGERELSKAEPHVQDGAAPVQVNPPAGLPAQTEQRPPSPPPHTQRRADPERGQAQQRQQQHWPQVVGQEAHALALMVALAGIGQRVGTAERRAFPAAAARLRAEVHALLLFRELSKTCGPDWEPDEQERRVFWAAHVVWQEERRAAAAAAASGGA